MDLQLMKILVVDDEEANLTVLQAILRRFGYTQLACLQDPRLAVERFATFEPDLLILDYHMPYLDGLEVMEALQPVIPPGSYFPILMLTADERPELRERALAGGARDFLTKPMSSTEIGLRVRNLLETRAFHLQLRGQNERLEGMVRERTAQLEQAQIEMLVRLARAAEYRDDESGEHVWRVARTSAQLAARLALPGEQVELLLRAARLHDVGKIGIPDGILLKPGRLTAPEFEVVKTHTLVGAQLLSGGQAPLIRMAETIALTHHERWDGSGYPHGLKGEEIPIEGRIMAVADAFDALTHDRAHQDAVGVPAAVEEIAGQRGRQFDPTVVDALLDLFESGELSIDA